MGTGEAMEGCSVCADDTGSEDNPLVYCDGKGCNVCVHKACYGIASIPTGDWFCSKCVFLRGGNSATTAVDDASSDTAAGGAETRVVKCQLCPSKEGALKPTSDGKWAHVVCALYIREALFKDTEVMEPIVTSQIPKDRFQQTCFICLEELRDADAHTGACSGCEKAGCRKAFHVTCAQRKGLLCEITRKNNKVLVVYSGFCTDHIPSTESGIVDGARFRKIPPYPRQPAGTASPTAETSPTNPDKASPGPSTNGAATTPTSSSETATTLGEQDSQRSSSIKSNASGSSGTTESADSGIHSSPHAEGDRVTVAAVSSGVTGLPLQQQQEEVRAIRRPPKKAYAARMEAAGGVPSPPVAAAATTNPSATSSVPSSFTPTPTNTSSTGSTSGGLGNSSPYYASNPFATPHEMPSLQQQFDLTRSSGSFGQQGALSVKSAQESARMSPYLPGKSHPMESRPTPPPLRKRALSPSILDNETLTISSLIERTIERATTSTAASNVPPPSSAFSSTVRPPTEDPNAAPKHEPASKKPKKAQKESKADPRGRGSNTATIKDLLANSGMSPTQQGGPGSMHSPAPPGDGAQQQNSSSSSAGGNGKASNKSKQPTSSVSGLSTAAFASMDGAGGGGGGGCGGGGGTHGDSPFSRNAAEQQRPLSPRSMLNRVEQDRHRHAVEKVQNYLNNNVPSDGPPPAGSGGSADRPLSSSTGSAAADTAGGAGKAKRKGQEDRGRGAPAGKAALNQPPQMYAPTQETSSARNAQQQSRADDHMVKRTNGYVNGSGGGGGGGGSGNNGNGSNNNSNGTSPDNVDTPAGAQAFDSFMMALSTFGMNAAHQSAMNTHPTAATTLDGFFRMQKELNILKQKVGELESLKAFYLTQVQSLRTLASKHQTDSVYPMVQPTMPEEVARLLMTLNGDSISVADENIHQRVVQQQQQQNLPPQQQQHHLQTSSSSSNSKNHHAEANASDGLSARLHEPSGPQQQSSSRESSSQRSSRPDSRLPNNSSSSSHSNYGSGNVLPQNVRGGGGEPMGQSPSSTPKPSVRSRGAGQSGRDPEPRGGDREREYVNGGGGGVGGGGGGYSVSSSARRGGQYPHLEHMDGVATGVMSTPAPVVSQPQLINMAGAPFLMQNPQLYSMIDPRMFGMMQGQAGFYPQAFAQGMGGFMPSANPADYAGLGRMHTPTSMSGRYQMDDGGHSSSGTPQQQQQQQHASLKREYEMSRDS